MSKLIRKIMKKKILSLLVLVLLSSCCWLLGEDKELKTVYELTGVDYTVEENGDVTEEKVVTGTSIVTKKIVVQE